MHYANKLNMKGIMDFRKQKAKGLIFKKQTNDLFKRVVLQNELHT